MIAKPKGFKPAKMSWRATQVAADEVAKLGLVNARLDVRSGKYDDDKYLAIVYDRPETDEELDRRVTQEKRSDEWQRAEYERLRKKFEGK